MKILRRGPDNLTNGLILGAIFGLLIASSNISWIQSIVTAVVDAIPVEYHFQYVSYVVWGFLGMLAGYIVDRV